ncbi:hypothetical protein MCEL_28840 [Mycolicibacterium celeriflavum]|uniref:Uncharacterized protein n=1 Tax=Mycolicibacterium celeriflavum TaxID=1249101 RepID=A0A7I7RL05_MYCCF|nr:hypothetical protein MCEL_28840 [Mycolicibacterium celeriflavum]
MIIADRPAKRPITDNLVERDANLYAPRARSVYTTREKPCIKRALDGGYGPGGGAVTVSVTVSVLVSVLVLTLVVGGTVVVVVVVVVVGSVVVVIGGAVVVGVTVSVTVSGVAEVVAVAVRDVVVSGVNEVGSVVLSSLIRLASPHTIRATINAPSAPKATRAAGLRYQGTGPWGGWP